MTEAAQEDVKPPCWQCRYWCEGKFEIEGTCMRLIWAGNRSWDGPERPRTRWNDSCRDAER